MSLSRRERRSAGPDRHDDAGGRRRGNADGAPGAVRGGGVSKSATKALRTGIGGEKKRGISTILFRRPGSIGVFVADLDNLRRRGSLRGAPQGGRRPRRSPPPDAETCISHSKAQFQSLFSRVKYTSRRGRGRSWLVRTAAPIPPRDIPSELAGKAQLCWWVFLWLVGAGSVMGVMVPVGGVPPCRGFPFFCRPVSRRRCRAAGRRVRRCRAVSRRPARRRCLVRRVGGAGGGGAPGGARWRWWWRAGRWPVRAVAGRPRR